MTHDKKDDLDKTMSHLHSGYRNAVQQIITNPVFNDDLFKKSYPSDKKVDDRKVEDKKVEDERFKSKHRRDNKNKKGGEKSPSPRGDRSPSPNPKTPSRKEQTTKGTGPGPKCPGCGTWLSEKHSTESCIFIKDKLKGYNTDWEMVAWDDSEAGKAAKARGFDFLKKNKSMTDPKTGTDCNNCLSMSD
jgi:hypothetical protein